MKAEGKNYNVGSEHKWADWQVPPVACIYCGKRVTLKHHFGSSYLKGTWHMECVQ